MPGHACLPELGGGKALVVPAGSAVLSQGAHRRRRGAFRLPPPITVFLPHFLSQDLPRTWPAPALEITGFLMSFTGERDLATKIRASLLLPDPSVDAAQNRTYVRVDSLTHTRLFL